MRMTLGPLGLSSASVNVRPTRGVTRSSGIMLALTCAELMRCGSDPPRGSETLAALLCQTPMLSRDRASFL
jgi:hypothetical protein